MGNRSRIFKYWFSKKGKGVSFLELFTQAYFGIRTEGIAKKWINRIEESNSNLKVYLKTIKHPLFVPKEFPINQLYLVIAESFYKPNWHYYERFGTLVSPNDVVVDCGAAEGLFSLIIANRCKTCYAIEPLPGYVETLKLTFKNIENVEVLPYALGSISGISYISGSGINASLTNDKSGTEVKIETIDNLFYKKKIPVSYLKADLEGYDFEMIKGAKNTIKHHKPKIAITTYHKESHAKEISEFLKNINPDYNIKCKGIESNYGSPMMLHAWIG